MEVSCLPGKQHDRYPSLETEGYRGAARGRIVWVVATPALFVGTLISTLLLTAFFSFSLIYPNHVSLLHLKWSNSPNGALIIPSDLCPPRIENITFISFFISSFVTKRSIWRHTKMLRREIVRDILNVQFVKKSPFPLLLLKVKKNWLYLSLQSTLP